VEALRLALREAEAYLATIDTDRVAGTSTFRTAEAMGGDALNTRIGKALLEDGRVYVGTTRYGGRVAFRPAIVNWRTTEADVDLITDVIRELGARVLVAA
jgi:glutamate/tyrosine decarboxylase-like PLP-dependent enzyme